MHFRAVAVAAVTALVAARAETDDAHVSDDVAGLFNRAHDGHSHDGHSHDDHAHSQKTKDFLEEMQKLFADLPHDHDGHEGHDHAHDDEASKVDFEDIMRRFDEMLKKHGDGGGELDELFKHLGADLEDGAGENGWSDGAWGGDLHNHHADSFDYAAREL